MCCCFQQWSVECSHIHRPCSGWPHNTDAHQDRHIMQAVVATQTAFRKEIWAHVVAPAVSLRTIGNHLLAPGLRSCVPLARLLLTSWHCQAHLLWCLERVEWCSVVFSGESRSCLYASDERKCVRYRPCEHHLLECIPPWHTGPTSGFMVWGTTGFNSLSHLVFLQGKVNSVRYIAQVVNPVLLPFLQHDNAYPHMCAVMQCALHGVQQLPWQARLPDLSPIENVWVLMKWELTLFSRACHNHCRIVTTGAKCLGKCIAGCHLAPLWHLNARIHACIATRRSYTVYWCDCLGTSYCYVCFFWSEFVIIYSYNDKLTGTSVLIQWTWSWWCCIFSSSVYISFIGQSSLLFKLMPHHC